MNSTSSDPTTTPSTAERAAAVDRHPAENEQQQQQQPVQQQRNYRHDDNNNNHTSNCSNLLTRFLKLMDRQPPLLAKSLAAAVIGALGGALGSYLAAQSSSLHDDSSSSQRRGSKSKQQRQIIDWLDVFSFAIYGGFVGGPLGHYWDEWLKEHGPASRSQAMLLDQLIAQPPRLLLMYIVLDLTRSALRELPASWHRSWSLHLSPAVALSWRVWPIASYLVLGICNNKNKNKGQQTRSRSRRRCYTMAIHTCALLFVTELARRRQVVLRKISA